MSVDGTRVVVPALQGAEIDLPDEVQGLYELAYNFWWSWNPEARQLFSAIDASSWSRYRNPVELLLNADRRHWEALIGSDTFLSSYGEVMRSFERYQKATDTWFRRRHPDFDGGPVAYFSMEFGLHQSLGIYSGGLGVLSGDHCKSASDLGLPFVAVGLLYRLGYFRQAIDADGFQQHIYPEFDFSRLPLRPVMDRRGGHLTVSVPLPQGEVAVRVWLAQVGRVPLLLLDTSVPENDPADRPITQLLYVRGREIRLAQEVVLGVGGVRALEGLGVQPGRWHLNEGHSSLLQLERLARATAGGAGFEQALENVRSGVTFTTHTPVPAGNETFDRSLARGYFEPWSGALQVDVERLLDLGGADHGEPGQELNLTAFALRTCGWTNGVSRINAEISDRMWRHLFPHKRPEEPAVEAITNGIHVPTWIGLEMRSLFSRVLGSDWVEKLLEPEAWEAFAAVDDEELWAVHGAQKERLLRFTRSRLRDQGARHGLAPRELRLVGEMFEPRALIIGFARRFATYKRAGLIFTDIHRLRGLLAHPAHPVRIFISGKAHPADREGQGLIRHIYRLSQEEGLRGRVVFLENYDMRVARMLVQGVDVWLNTPRRPQEASGTSGQKAAANGVLNCSILDGWWPEGFDGSNGWAIGGEGVADQAQQDRDDAAALYETLEREIIPTFYEREGGGPPRRWVAMMKRAVATIAPAFSSSRMVRDYTERAYFAPAGEPVETGGGD